MRILVFGGTAFFGKEIVKLFHEGGHEVTLFTRGNVYPSDLPPCRKWKGDRENELDLKQVAKQGPWDIIIDNLAFTGQSVAKVLGQFSTGRYLLTSTVSVYRYSPSWDRQPLKEDDVDFKTPPSDQDLNNIHWQYAHGKWEAERTLRNQKRIPWTIIRPTVVYGPFDSKERGFWYLLRMMKGGPLLLANGGVGRFRLSYSVDVARFIFLIVASQVALFKTYNVASEEIITLRDFCLESSKVLNLTPDLVEVPLNELGEELAGPLGTLINVIPDTGVSKRELGFQSTPWPEVAALSAVWFRDHWKGDPNHLLKSRQAEIAFAKKWKK